MVNSFCNLQILSDKIYLDDVEVAQLNKNNEYTLLENIPIKYINFIISNGKKVSFSHLLKSYNLGNKKNIPQHFNPNSDLKY